MPFAVLRAKQYKCESLEILEAFFLTLVGATMVSVWGDIFHHPDDEAVLDSTLACVRWMHSEWDGLSGWTRFPDTKKATRRGLQLIYVRRYTQDKPRPNIRASVQAEAYKVHREFRKQRRPHNVAFVLRRTVRAGNLICLRPDRRFSYELAASRYLILVVPGARLGSVSLASVWKCSVYTFLPSRNIS